MWRHVCSEHNQFYNIRLGLNSSWTICRSDQQLLEKLLCGYCCPRRFCQLLNPRVLLLIVFRNKNQCRKTIQKVVYTFSYPCITVSFFFNLLYAMWCIFTHICKIHSSRKCPQSNCLAFSTQCIMFLNLRNMKWFYRALYFIMCVSFAQTQYELWAGLNCSCFKPAHLSSFITFSSLHGVCKILH